MQTSMRKKRAVHKLLTRHHCSGGYSLVIIIPGIDSEMFLSYNDTSDSYHIIVKVEERSGVTSK